MVERKRCCLKCHFLSQSPFGKDNPVSEHQREQLINHPGAENLFHKPYTRCCKGNWECKQFQEKNLQDIQKFLTSNKCRFFYKNIPNVNFEEGWNLKGDDLASKRFKWSIGLSIVILVVTVTVAIANWKGSRSSNFPKNNSTQEIQPTSQPARYLSPAR